jgi:hypothetical protein
MAITEIPATTSRITAPLLSAPYLQWGPVIAGAFTAAALATVLHAFAGAIGLAVSSAAPTWRDASVGLMILSGVYLILVALASYGLGGYIAGLLRERFSNSAILEEVEFRDSIHGLLVWAVATLLTALLLVMATSASSRVAAPAATSASASTASESTIAYDIDRLLRGGERRAADAVDSQQLRGEVGRILLTSSSHSGVAADDRAYLVRLVGARTGLAPNDAERRVDTAIANAKDNLSRARKSGVILAFMAGAAALIGAAAAWFAAVVGGQHRDDSAGVSRWNILGRRVRV